MKYYYKIGEKHSAWGLFELWESEKWGDETPAVVTLNGKYIDKTWDDLDTWYSEDWEPETMYR